MYIYLLTQIYLWHVKERKLQKHLVSQDHFYVTIYIFKMYSYMTARKEASVQFSRSVVSDSSRSHESQHARPHCPSPTPGVHSDSRPLSQWCHPAISSSVVPFSSCPQSLPASGSFPMSQLFTWGGQSIGASASVLPMNIQGRFPLGLTGLISLLFMELSESSPTPQFESINSSVLSFLYSPTLTSIHDYWRNQSFDYMGLCQQSDTSTF